MPTKPLYLLSLPGLTRRLFERTKGVATTLAALAAECAPRLLIPVMPASGAPAQATMLTGVLPQQHGVCIHAVKPVAPAFWQRASGLSVCAALWDEGLGLNTVARPKGDVHGRNGDFVMRLLRDIAGDVNVFRLRGILGAALADGPMSDAAQHRVARMDEVVGACWSTARERGGAFCLTGELGVSDVMRRLDPQIVARPFDGRIIASGGLLHVFAPKTARGLFDVATEVAHQPGIERVLVGLLREEIGLNHANAGDVVAVGAKGVAFDQSHGVCGAPVAELDEQPILLMWNFDEQGEPLKPRVGAAELAWRMLHQLTGKCWADNAGK